jgi:polyisoprenoid-binding protein YceI
MKKLIVIFVILLTVKDIKAQVYFTKSGIISFDATASSSPENIKAVNNSAVAVLKTTTGEMQFSVQIKGFVFERALMQEHFNDNYLESSKYPQGDFKGKVTNNNVVNYNKEGTYNVIVEGVLNIHGVSKNVKANGTIQVKGGLIVAAADFKIALKNFMISIPGLVSNKISKEPVISINCKMGVLKK